MKESIDLKLKVLRGQFETIQIGFAAIVDKGGKWRPNEHVLMLPDRYVGWMDGEVVKVTISKLGKKDVCAWCHGEYDKDGKVFKYLNVEEYSQVESHGICKDCAKKLKVEIEDLKRRQDEQA